MSTDILRLIVSVTLAVAASMPILLMPRHA